MNELCRECSRELQEAFAAGAEILSRLLEFSSPSGNLGPWCHLCCSPVPETQTQLCRCHSQGHKPCFTHASRNLGQAQAFPKAEDQIHLNLYSFLCCLVLPRGGDELGVGKS